MSFWHGLLGVLFLVICFLLIIIILLQKGKGGGLGAAFGGAGSSAFGTRTGDVFTCLFLLLAITTNLSFRPPAGLVAAPTFSLPPQPIPESQSVDMSCSTDGATIRFTTDGTDPDENSAAYTKPVRVSPGTILKARAFREKWTPSAVVGGEYKQAGPTTAASPSMVIPAKPAAPVTPAVPAKPAPAKPAAPVTPAVPATAPATAPATK